MDVYVVLYEHASKGYELEVLAVFEKEEKARELVRKTRTDINENTEKGKTKDTCWFMKSELIK